MLKSLFASVLAFGFVTTAHATSLHPCTPMVRAQSTTISCSLGGNRVGGVTVETLMSDVRSCPNPKDWVEYKTATVRVTDMQGNLYVEKDLKAGEFQYSTSPSGDAKFAFKNGKKTVKWNNCATPVFGGVSFGN